MSTTLTQPTMTDAQRQPMAAASAGQEFDGPCRQVPSATLLQGHKAVEINHNGAIYRLQSTKLGKLILTK